MDESNLTGRPSILVVDDDPVVCSLMRATLQRDGFEVIEAGDGAEGCRLYQEHRPNLLLVDVIMPRMDGYELCRELRTPLNAIIGFSGMMSDRMFGPLGDKYVEYANIIGTSGRHLLAIITDILDLAKADADKLLLAEEEIDIAEVVELGAQIVHDMAQRAQIDFACQTEEPLPSVIGDAAKLTQILVNLLSNAIKFTPPGGKVRLKVEHREYRGMIFRIEDTGVGMSAEQIPVAFRLAADQTARRIARRQDRAEQRAGQGHRRQRPPAGSAGLPQQQFRAGDLTS